MAFDMKSRAATNNAFGPGTAGMGVGVGKQTLTQQLAMAQPQTIQNKGGAAQSDDKKPKIPVGESIEHTLAGYQHIGVSVPLPNREAEADHEWDEPRRYGTTDASAPYWNSRYTDAKDTSGITPPSDFNPEVRGDALAGLGHGVHDAVMAGKGSPAQIKEAIEQALALAPPLIARPSLATTEADSAWLTAWNAAINTWLVAAGIGVDCSGFVYNALVDAQANSDVVTSRHNPDAANAPVGILDNYPNPSTGATKASDEAMGAQGIELKDPATELVAGDTIYLPDNSVGHVIIVMSVSRAAEGVVSFTAAESSAGSNGARGGLVTHTWQLIGRTIQRDDGVSYSSPQFRHQIVPSAQPAQPAATT